MKQEKGEGWMNWQSSTDNVYTTTCKIDSCGKLLRGTGAQLGAVMP